MSLKIRVREIGRIAVLDLEGSMRHGNSQDAFREQMQRLLDADTVQVAVNLARVLARSGLRVVLGRISQSRRERACSWCARRRISGGIKSHEETGRAFALLRRGKAEEVSLAGEAEIDDGGEVGREIKGVAR